MLRHRVIPALLLHGAGLVKTLKFRRPRYVGDPINAIRIFNDKEVDELMVLDISASREGRGPNFDLIEQFAGECFMPLAYGGGITTMEDAARLFSLGVEKVCLQTAAMKDSRLITELAGRFGSQSVMVSVDVARNWFGVPKLYAAARRKVVSTEWIEFMRRMVVAGAGEVLFNAVSRDGTLGGPDLGLIRQAAEAVPVPLIAMGGVSSLSDIKAVVEAGASAVAAGSYFVFHGPHRAVLITYPRPQELENLFVDSGTRGA